MPIFGSDGALVGVVHRVAGVRIVIAHEGVGEAELHYIPLAWVASVTDRVTLDCPADQARPKAAGDADPLGTRKRRTIGPYIWGGIGVLAVSMAVVGGGLIVRNARNHKPTAAPAVAAPSAAPARTTVAIAAKRVAVPALEAPTAPGGVALASPQTIAEFLNSNAPAPQRFSFDAFGFAPGSAALTGEADKSIRGIADVMRAHLNTKIKLAMLPGGGAVALRRLAAARDALIAHGVAPYRIATGAARKGAVPSKSGVEIVVLAK